MFVLQTHLRYFAQTHEDQYAKSVALANSIDGSAAGLGCIWYISGVISTTCERQSKTRESRNGKLGKPQPAAHFQSFCAFRCAPNKVRCWQTSFELYLVVHVPGSSPSGARFEFEVPTLRNLLWRKLFTDSEKKRTASFSHSSAWFHRFGLRCLRCLQGAANGRRFVAWRDIRESMNSAQNHAALRPPLSTKNA